MRSSVSLSATIASATVVASALWAGCSSPQTDQVTVFAAASLKSTFSQLGAQFERVWPGTTVRFNFAGSADLVAQLAQGAPADVFASANTRTMTEAADAGLIAGDPVNFASNTLTIVTPPGNTRAIGSFADLVQPSIQVVICAPQVPCGSATEMLEHLTGVTLSPVSEESSVTDVLGKITSGQADAGLVYLTDAAEAGSAVDAVAFPESARVVNNYPIAVLNEARDPARARRFLEFVAGPEGRAVLTAAGFGPP